MNKYLFCGPPFNLLGSNRLLMSSPLSDRCFQYPDNSLETEDYCG